jgi:hypothetical protein
MVSNPALDLLDTDLPKNAFEFKISNVIQDLLNNKDENVH